MNFKPIFPNHILKPILIAGPCSAESEEQVLYTARTLATYNEIDYFRASIWKPRTHPGSFEGIGEKGLQWLQQVKKETCLKVCTEVASTQHVELALKAGIDMCWIGARTTVNPFLINEIAESLKGCNIPIMIKNPVNPDLDLWIGAFERFYQKNITQLAAIHRGFTSFKKSIYRNEPFWELIFELKRRYPNLPVISDPSHMTGNNKLVLEMSQQALNLEADGLMIEVHPNPTQAWTDKEQQLTFEEFDYLLKTVVYRPYSENNITSEILQLRTQIDELDSEIIKSLSHRMELVREIGNIKRQNQLTILQMNRWKDIIESRLNIGEHEGIKKDFLLKILQTIHEESLRIQEDIFKQ